MLSAENLKIATDIANGYAFSSPQHVALSAVITAATERGSDDLTVILGRAVEKMAETISAQGDQLLQINGDYAKFRESVTTPRVASR